MRVNLQERICRRLSAALIAAMLLAAGLCPARAEEQTIGQRMTHHRALDAGVWAMPMLHFNGMRSAVMESGLINLKK